MVKACKINILFLMLTIAFWFMLTTSFGAVVSASTYKINWSDAKANGWMNPLVEGSELITSSSYDYLSKQYEKSRKRQHTGVDIHHPEYQPIHAIAAGEVVRVVRFNDPMTEQERLKLVVIIRHEGCDEDGTKRGFFAVYGHILADDYIKEGVNVDARKRIGEIRQASSPSHLHFGINTSSKLEEFLTFLPTGEELGWGRIPTHIDPLDYKWVDPIPYLNSFSTIADNGLIEQEKDTGEEYIVAAVLVIDVSGSMADRWEGGIKIDSARQAALSLLNLLEEENSRPGYRYNVALVDFAQNASIVQPLTSDFSRLREAVASLNPRGATNIGDGLEKAFQQLHAAEYDRAFVILLSDGITNRGRNPAEILRWLEGRVKPVSVSAPEGLQVSLYGADYNRSKPTFPPPLIKDIDTTGNAMLAKELLESVGYQADAYLNQPKEMALQNLPRDALFFFVGHSKPKFLQFLEHNNVVDMLSSEVRPLTLDGLILAVLAGCNTAKDVTRQENILRTFIQAGAQVGTGFSCYVHSNGLNHWNNAFWKALVDGATVKEAVLSGTADSFFQSRVIRTRIPPGDVVAYPAHMAEKIRLVDTDTTPPWIGKEDKPPRVYTVGFGNPGDLDEDLLISIARITGGEYFYGGQADALQNIFLRTQHQGTGQVYAEFEGSILQGQEVEAGRFTLPRGESELRVTLNWPGSHLDLRLYDPQGRLVDADYRGAKVWRTERPAYVVLETPRGGDWRVEVYGREVPKDGTSYYVVASTSDIPATKTGFLEPLMIMAFMALVGFIWVPRWLQSQKMGNGVSASIKSCPRCGGTIHETDRFCSDCGLSQPKTTRRSFSFRYWAILALSLFLVLGLMQLLGGRLVFSPGKEAGDVRQESDVPILGKVYDQRLHDTWEYSGGMLEEYVAYNNTGNRLTIYQDLYSGELQGFTAALPAAANMTLSLEEARQSAEKVARQMPFFTDSTLRLKEEILVNHGPDTEQYYSFHWLAEDLATKAILLREIRIGVHPENGKIIYLLTEDSGEVTIPTAPSIAGREARNLASSEIGELLQRPRVVEEVLYVSAEHGEQWLLWLIVFEETARDAWPQRVYVDLDAHSGEILGMGT